MSAEQNNDPGSFHLLTAGFVKDLLAARAKTDPDFVTPEMHKRWGLDADFPGPFRAELFLDAARERLDEIYKWPTQKIGSLSPHNLDDANVKDAKLYVKRFVTSAVLQKALSAAENGQQIDWESGFHWDELDAIRDLLDRLPHPPGQPAKRELQEVWLAQAMLLVRDNPGWSDAEIARRVGKNKSTLSRSTEYQNAAAMARGEKDNRKRGHITVDPESGLRDIEAYSDDPAEQDWDE